MNRITIELTKDQAEQVVRILDYGKADHTDPTFTAEDRKFNSFLSRIQAKIRKQLQTL